MIYFHPQRSAVRYTFLGVAKSRTELEKSALREHSCKASNQHRHLLNLYIYCWQCISSQFLVNNQHDVLFHVFIYSFHLSTCFEHQVLIIRRSNCINTLSGMISLCKWLLGMPVSSLLTGIPSSHLHRLIIPDDVLLKFDLLMMSTVTLETCRQV
jgi:hypothetical protein